MIARKERLHITLTLIDPTHILQASKDVEEYLEEPQYNQANLEQ